MSTVTALGVDLVEIVRIERSMSRYGARFLDRCFTPAERSDAERAGAARTVERYAARFAAKEAAMKALGTGWSAGVSWREIEITNGPAGAPSLRMTGRAATLAGERGITSWLCSLSHTHESAVAAVIGLG